MRYIKLRLTYLHTLPLCFTHDIVLHLRPDYCNALSLNSTGALKMREWKKQE